ncbi:hypothetical protein [Bartonella raoultii]|uniref:Uncharacterized protein n=1 Tax=Bartonella raoultii TaxID=1457020 RepID=A0ABS7I5P4_9HYPH|nr:hypothetical protein [Bartonella raoultii]MBX4335687.1 hypothetical protein [Bartonella raoultii]
MAAPSIMLAVPYLSALAGQGLRTLPHIMRFLPHAMKFGARAGARTAAQTNNLVRSMATGMRTGTQQGAQRLGQLISDSPVAQSLMQHSPLLSPFVGAGVESFMKHLPKQPSPLQQQESPIPGPYPDPISNALEEIPTPEETSQDLKHHVDVPQAQPLAPTSQTPPPEPTDLEKFLQSNTYKFFQSDAYQKLKDLFAGMSAAPSGGSGWDALASGVKHLNEGDKQRGRVNQTVEYLKSKGYSEEEARVMASNPQMLSALLTGGDAPAGFQWYTNPETGEREQRPIKGSPQELEYNQKLQAHKEWESRKRNNMFATKMHLRAGLNDLKAAFELLKEGKENGFTRWLTQELGGSKGYRLKKLLEGIRGSILKTVFENLKSMSASGNTGVGPISEFESKVLSSMFGSLDVGRNKEELERTFEIIQTAFNFFNKYNDLQLYNAFTGQPLDTPKEISDQYFVDSPRSQGGGANWPIVSGSEEANKMPIGVEVIYNGKVHRRVQ